MNRSQYAEQRGKCAPTTRLCPEAFWVRFFGFAAVAILLTAFHARADDVLRGVDVFATPAGESKTELLPPGVCFPEAVPSFSVRGDPVLIQGQEIDTIIERLDDALLPGCPASDTVGLVIRWLSLVSEAPVTIGGQDYNVQVCVSDVNAQPVGQITINHNCPAGGTFNSVLPVVPKFIFTPVAGGSSVICDPPGAVLRLPQDLVASGGWVHQASGGLGSFQVGPIASVGGPCGATFSPSLPGSSNFVPGISPSNCTCSSQKSGGDPQCERLTGEEGSLAAHGVLPQALGSEVGCCVPTGACKEMSKTECLELSGGNALMVPAGVCTALEACCFPDGSCRMMDPSCCQCDGGVPQGPGSKCKGDNNFNGIDDTCEAPIPTTSQWGLIVLLLSLLVAAKILYGRKRRHSAA